MKRVSIEKKFCPNCLVVAMLHAMGVATGIDLDRKKLSVPDHIKSLGEYSVTARLHHDVQFGININVISK